MAAALSEGKYQVDNVNVHTKVERESKKIGEKEENVSQTEARLEIIENVGHGLVRQHQQADHVPQQPGHAGEGRGHT